jgi:poly-gamma-glutamate capsule biosynthesis protein CapA/YwtB (metallophosphatase superfamily)
MIFFAFLFISFVQATTLQIVGDVLLGTDYPTGSFTHPSQVQLKSVKSLVQGADLLVGNYEGTFCQSKITPKKCENNKNCYAFKLPPKEAVVLKNLGFDYLSHANNHAYDFEGPCLASTLATFQAHGILTSGLKDTYSRFVVSGVRITIISFHSSQHFNSTLDLSLVKDRIAPHRNTSDFILVYFHGGAEGKRAVMVPEGIEFFFGENRGDVRSFAHQAIDAGADIVVGSGPHVIRGSEIYKGKLIAYSLGDFIFPVARDAESFEPYGISLQVEIGTSKELNYRWVSFKRDAKGWPVFDPKNEGRSLVESRSLFASLLKSL